MKLPALNSMTMTLDDPTKSDASKATLKPYCRYRFTSTCTLLYVLAIIHETLAPKMPAGARTREKKKPRNYIKTIW